MILVRDLGQERLPPALVTLGSLAVFLLLCHAMHRRDQRVAEARGLAPVGAGT